MLIIIFAILVFLIVKFMMSNKTKSGADESGLVRVRVAHVGAIFEQLKLQHNEKSYAIFTFNTHDRPNPPDAVNLQFSIENSHAGFNWMLVSKRNIEDRERFVELAKSEGFEIMEREKNGKPYLRIEDENAPTLCSAIMKQFYGLYPDDYIFLLAKGFEWKG